MSEPAAAPAWFTKAIEAPAESRTVDVDGTPIHYLIWNAADTHKPGLLFAHGFRAHARWWTFIAPFLMSRFRVASLDFAGMGDSGTRREYTSDSFTHDLLGVLDHAGFDESATLVGHSFGGGRVMRTCADHPQRVSRAIVIDSHVHLSDEPRQRHMELRPKRLYPTFEAARARFRLVPPQNRAAPYIIDYVGRHSLQQVEGGWTWKFDETLMPKWDDVKPRDVLSRIELPVTFIYGDDSAIVSRQHAHEIVKHIRNCRGPVAIPQSHHHVLLDQPLSLVSALKAVLY